jgi:ppGpp synthetase/RelA/SpoT-type nucleotidyltranferase
MIHVGGFAVAGGDVIPGASIDINSTMGDNDSTTEEKEAQLLSFARDARRRYEAVRGLYDDFARSIASVIEGCLANEQLAIHSITSRAKDPESFEHKAAQPSAADPLNKKYEDPFEEITDKAGVRITTYFLSTVDRVSQIIEAQFSVREKTTKTTSEPDRLGYQSVHYLVSYSSERITLPEYNRFSGLIAEIQVRTILQHAWAEIEHDIQYKAISALPDRVKRRFASLAGLIEIADREFQAIDNENQIILREARRNVDIGQLDRVEITPDSLRAYLDKKYQPDGRMTDFSYQYVAEQLRALGFNTLADLDECTRGYDDDIVSRVIYGSRQGQLRRLEDVVLASMGEGYIKAHPWTLRESSDLWYPKICLQILTRLTDAGIEIGSYRPPSYPELVLQDEALYALKRQLYDERTIE